MDMIHKTLLINKNSFTYFSNEMVLLYQTHLGGFNRSRSLQDARQSLKNCYLAQPPYSKNECVSWCFNGCNLDVVCSVLHK